MQLPPDLFERLTGEAVPGPGTAAPGGHERRQHGRLQFGHRAQVRVGAGPWATVVIRDISVVGIGFLADRRLDPGQAFTLRTTGEDDVAITLACVVHRCEAGGVGGVAFFVGSTFDGGADAAPAGATATEPAPVAPRRSSLPRTLLGRLLRAR